MSKTVVGLFSTMAEANKAKQELLAEGFESQDIKVMADEEGTATGSAPTANDAGYTDVGSGGGTGIGEKVSSFFRSLSGGDNEAHHHYATGVNSGGALVAVTAADDEAAEIAELLQELGARDIEGGTNQSSLATTEDYSAASTTAADGVVVPIVEEELIVGKREVDRGGVRVYSHVVETPVNTDINLREEHIKLERRVVNRPATAADFVSGTGSVIELIATGEEAVVGKTSRVVEEVLVGKQTTERTHAIHDSVRRTEVEVEELPAESLVSNTSSEKERF